MSTATQARRRVAGGNRLMLHDVSWHDYLVLLRAFNGRNVRLTYDRGVLEIMTLSHKHESKNYLLARFVDMLLEVLVIPAKGGGSTTFKKRKKDKGAEPDSCWWIQNEGKVRGKEKIDLNIDPPPDLALEIEISRSWLNRMRIWARLGIQEVWTFDGAKLSFFGLQADATYVEIDASRAFPKLQAQDLLPFLMLQSHMDETSVRIQFRQWVDAEYRNRLKP